MFLMLLLPFRRTDITQYVFAEFQCLVILLGTGMKTITTIFYYYHQKKNKPHSSDQISYAFLPQPKNFF